MADDEPELVLLGSASNFATNGRGFVSTRFLGDFCPSLSASDPLKYPAGRHGGVPDFLKGLTLRGECALSNRLLLPLSAWYSYVMSDIFTAIYEHGILRPLQPLNLPEHTQVEVIIQHDPTGDWVDQDALRMAETEGDDSISLQDVRRQLASIPGSLAESVIAERGEY